MAYAAGYETVRLREDGARWLAAGYAAASIAAALATAAAGYGLGAVL